MTMQPRTLEPPEHFLEQVWMDALMKSVTEVAPVNPWPQDTPQATLWDLAVRAGREMDEWEATLPTQVERELIEQMEYEERERTTPEGDISPDTYARYIKSACANILSFLANQAPTCLINGERERLRNLVDRFTMIPTKFERDYGRTPMQEPDDV